MHRLVDKCHDLWCPCASATASVVLTIHLLLAESVATLVGVLRGAHHGKWGTMKRQSQTVSHIAGNHEKRI